VPLVAAGTEFLPRLRQFDVSVAKTFNWRSTRLQGQIDIFNVLNVNTFTAVLSTNYDTAAYAKPASVLQGRMIRLGVQAKW
jgi:hypothetical protein